MSTLEYNTLSAGGDSAKRNVAKPSVRRTPIPSSRRLATRPQTAKNENVKRKLKDALDHLSTPTSRSRFCRKRSQTVAEITPSKRRVPNDNNKSSTKLVAADGGKGKSPPRKEDAGRRVYQQLLLNAWRRRRVQVATLTDSSRQLQAQVDQLQMQVDVLQKLRESESQRRSESAAEAERLRLEVHNLQKSFENLQQDRGRLETQIDNLNRKVEELNASRTNIKNELLTTRGELSLCESKLQKSYSNEATLKQENQILFDKIDKYKDTTSQQIEMIQRLEEHLEVAQKNLEEASLNNSSLEESRIELETKLTKEKADQFVQSRIREEKLERKIYELKENLHLLKEAKRRKSQKNHNLRRILCELENSLREERDKKWWKSTAKFMLNTIHSAAYWMLPVYTDVVDNYTPAENENPSVENINEPNENEVIREIL